MHRVCLAQWESDGLKFGCPTSSRLPQVLCSIHKADSFLLALWRIVEMSFCKWYVHSCRFQRKLLFRKLCTFQTRYRMNEAFHFVTDPSIALCTTDTTYMPGLRVNAMILTLGDMKKEFWFVTQSHTCIPQGKLQGIVLRRSAR
jgi:hypothetical protein